ncbi:hypothetical protein ACS0TY_035797 [Phlomoides rotata]
MSTYHLALRCARHLSTAASAASAVKPITISQVKKKLNRVQGPDEGIKIYSDFAAANGTYPSPASARHAQELAVRRLANSHRFSDIETFLESHKSQPQITQEPFLSSLIRSYGFAGMFENALNTYQQMTDFGTPRSSLSFNALLGTCINCKEFDRVPVFFNEFPENYGFEPDKFSYGMLIKAYCEMGSFEMAIEKMNEMQEKGIDGGAISFTTILHSFYKNGRNDDAEKFWDEMVNKKGCKLDVGSYNVRLSQIHGWKPEVVKALIEEMKNAGIKPDVITRNYLITCYCINDMMDEAEEAFKELLMVKGHRPNAATFRTMVFYSCKKGRYVKAYKIFKLSVKVGKIPDFNTLKYLLRGLVNMERMVEAKAMVRTMNKKFPPESLKAWEKLVDELGLARVETEEELDSGEAEGSHVEESKKEST